MRRVASSQGSGGDSSPAKLRSTGGGVSLVQENESDDHTPAKTRSGGAPKRSTGGGVSLAAPISPVVVPEVVKNTSSAPKPKRSTGGGVSLATENRSPERVNVNSSSGSNQNKPTAAENLAAAKRATERPDRGASDSSNKKARGDQNQSKGKNTYVSFYELAATLEMNKGPDIQRRKNNTYGVILSYTLPKALSKTASNKYMVSYFLADPSLHFSTKSHICLNVFGDRIEDFPVVHSVGDVIRCHRVEMQNWNGLQLVGSVCAPGKGKPGSAFVVFHAKFDPTGLAPPAPASDSPLEDPAQTLADENATKRGRWTNGTVARALGGKHLWDVRSSSGEFAFNELVDCERIRTYRGWAASMLMTTSLVDSITPTYSLQQICMMSQMQKGVQVAEKCDIVCMFVGAKVNNTGQFSVLLWDGTTQGSLSSADMSVWGRTGTVNDMDAAARGLSALSTISSAVHASTVYHDKTTVDISSIYDNAEMVARVKNPPVSATTDTENVKMLPGGVFEVAVATKGFVDWFSGKSASKNSPLPGSWLRLRNLRLELAAAATGINGASAATRVTAIVIADTHAVVLPPYAVDCTVLATSLKVRVDHQCNVMEQARSHMNSKESSSSMSNGDGLMMPPVGRAGQLQAGGSRSGSSAAQSQGQGQEQGQGGPRIAQLGTGGEKLSCLAEVFATPAPAKFCVRARIVGFWPNEQLQTMDDNDNGDDMREDDENENAERKEGEKGAKKKHDLSKFVMDKASFYAQVNPNPDGTDRVESPESTPSEGSNSKEVVMKLLSANPINQKEYLFALRIADHTGMSDVILSGNDARFFFDGVTASEFHHDWSQRHSLTSDAEADAEAEGEPSATAGSTPTGPRTGSTDTGTVTGSTDRIEEELMQVIGSGKILQFYLRSYSGVEDSQVACKRFAAFNTNLFQ